MRVMNMYLVVRNKKVSDLYNGRDGYESVGTKGVHQPMSSQTKVLCVPYAADVAVYALFEVYCGTHVHQARVQRDPRVDTRHRVCSIKYNINITITQGIRAHFTQPPLTRTNLQARVYKLCLCVIQLPHVPEGMQASLN
jgi:hypothetical protein